MVAITTIRMASPGNSDTHHDEMISSLPSETMRPQAGLGLGIPAPRKLRLASRMMTNPTCRVASTTRLLNTFGKMCLSIIRASDAPATLALATKSWTRTVRDSPRACLAYCAHRKMISTVTIVW